MLSLLRITEMSIFYKVKLGSISTDSMIGRNIELGINKPKNLSFNDLRYDKNKCPPDNSTNGILYGLSCDSSYDLFLDSPHDIMIQTWNRHIRSLSDLLNGYIIELMLDSLNDTVNDSSNDSMNDSRHDSISDSMNYSMNESMNDLMHDLMNDSLL